MKRVIALLLVLSMFLMSGCDIMAQVDKILGKTEENTTLPDENNDDEIDWGDESTINSGTSSNDESTTKKADSSNKNETTTKASANSDKPETVAEIVAYFNKNANRVKTEATKVVKNYEDREIGEIKAPAALQGAAEEMVTKFMADDTEPIEYSTREEIVENFQVPGQSYVSCLKPEEVEKAVCKDMGDYYQINIMVKDEENPTAGSGVGSVFDVVEPEEVENKSDMVEDFSTSYYDCVVMAKFDKETGRMTHANYLTPMTLKVTVRWFGKLYDASIEMSFEKDYTITY